jgi:hypothetical protein
MTNDSGQFGLTRRQAIGATGALLGGLALGGTAVAQQGGGMGAGGARRYRVTVTNLTSGQPFTPPAVALHRFDAEVFSVGDPANEAVKEIAENGNLDPLLALVEETGAIRGAGVFTAPNADGEMVPTPLVPEDDPADTGLPYFGTFEIEADGSATHLSFVSMLIATNDGFVGLDTVPLPRRVNVSRTYFVGSYDAGTEENTEQFADMVPPAQALIRGEVAIEGTGESDPDLATDGVITPHPGVAGDADLGVDPYDWTDPAAVLHVERVA